MTDDEALALRATVIGGERYADDFTAIWRDLTIGRIMKRSGVPSQADQWWLGFTFYRRPSLGGDMSGSGTDLDDCKAKFKAAWTSIRAGLTDEDNRQSARVCRDRCPRSPSMSASAASERGPLRHA